jgi:hypothetical protein
MHGVYNVKFATVQEAKIILTTRILKKNSTRSLHPYGSTECLNSNSSVKNVNV